MSIKTTLKKQRRLFKDTLNQRQPAVKNMLGIMGDNQGHLKVGDGRVYVTIGGVPYKAICRRVPPKYGQEVWVGIAIESGKSGKVYEILSDNINNATDPALIRDGGYAPASRYAWWGQDPLHIDKRALTMLRLTISKLGGMYIELHEGVIWTGTDFIDIATQDIDLTAHIPATVGKAALVMITVKNDGTIIQTKGSEVDIADIDATSRPAVPADTVAVLGCVRVYEGQTKIQEGKVNTDIDDLRFAWFAAGGGGAVNSVTGDGVNNTDPANPVMTFPTPSEIGALDKATYDPANIAEQLVGITASQTLTNKTINSITNYVDSDAIHIKIYNNSGGTLNRGQAVYVTQWNSGSSAPEVDKARANNVTTLPAIGLVEDVSIADGGVGEARVDGTLIGFDTSAWSDGVKLYVSPSTAGALTSTKPSGANYIQPIAIVVRQHATLGTVVVLNAGQADLAYLTSANIEDSIVDGHTTIAPSGNAVFDALALKEALSNKSTTLDTDKASDTKYPSVKSVYDWVVGKFISLTGWVEGTGTWSYSSADGAIFVISVNNDQTDIISVGDRIKLTQTTVKYFDVHAVGAYSGGATLITVYGGTDYTLANAAITSPYWSNAKAPFGFPMSPAKWSQTLTDTSRRTQSPTNLTWYNTGSLSIAMPIGTWRTSLKVTTRASGAPSINSCHATLSTANNSESNSKMTAFNALSASDIYSTTYTSDVITVTSKTNLYVNIRTTSSSTNIEMLNDILPLSLVLEDAYL